MSEKTVNTDMNKEFIQGQEISEWSIQETVGNGETGKDHIVPPACSLGVNIIVDSSQGKLQYSRSPRAVIKKDIEDEESNANWVDGEDGAVSVSTGKIYEAAVSGIRIVSVSGEVTLEAIAASR